jgi:hypothetical protein
MATTIHRLHRDTRCWSISSTSHRDVPLCNTKAQKRLQIFFVRHPLLRCLAAAICWFRHRHIPLGYLYARVTSRLGLMCFTLLAWSLEFCLLGNRKAKKKTLAYLLCSRRLTTTCWFGVTGFAISRYPWVAHALELSNASVVLGLLAWSYAQGTTELKGKTNTPGVYRTIAWKLPLRW